MSTKRTRSAHRFRIGLLAAIFAVVALTPLGPSVLAHGNDRAAPHRPTIVLVHGAWAGPAGWGQVAAELRWDGYRVVIPALGLADASADVAIVQTALDSIAGKKILVGHSYGGAVISQAAAGRTDVQALVYTAAFAPDEGESLVDLGAGYAPPAAFAPGHLLFQGPPRSARPSSIRPTSATTSPRTSAPGAPHGWQLSRRQPTSACSSHRQVRWLGTPCRPGTRSLVLTG